MSTTGPAVILRMRDIMREQQTGRPVFADAELREAINRHVQILAKELGLGTSWVTPIVSLVPGTVDYTLPSADEYQSVQFLRYADDLQPLAIRSFAEVVERRSGGLASGRPQFCCLRPTSTQTLVLMTDTDPVDGEDLDALVSLAPATWDASDSTAPTYALSEAASRALELRACASVVETAGAEKRNALAISDNAPKVWQAEAARLVELEIMTIIGFKRSRGSHGGSWFMAWASS